MLLITLMKPQKIIIVIVIIGIIITYQKVNTSEDLESNEMFLCTRSLSFTNYHNKNTPLLQKRLLPTTAESNIFAAELITFPLVQK